MKMKIIILFFFFFYSSSFSIEMPPSPPVLEKVISSKNLKESKLKQKKINDSANECLMVPKGLYLLPPPLIRDLEKCENKIYLPSITDASLSLSEILKKNITVLSIHIVKDFNQLYDLKTNERSYLCNKSITKCFQKTKIIKKEK